MTSARHEIDAALFGSLGPASRGRATDYVEAARLALGRMVGTRGLLDGRSLERRAGGYARSLLHGDGDVSVWAMVWDVGASTPVHDHHCSCCFALYSGALWEVSFRALDGATALRTGETVLAAGSVRCMLPSGPNLHQMVNGGDVEAVSIHVYGFDHRARASSVEREYRVVAQ